MTQETNVERSPQHLKEDKDWLLQVFVNIANTTQQFRIPVILTCHGFLVAGTLISGKAYLEKLSHQFNNGDGMFKTVIDTLYNPENQKNNSELPAYIHLESTKFYGTSGQSIPNNEGVVWRGRLSEISGFMLGTMEPALN